MVDKRERVLDPMTAYQITSMMEGVVQRGTATVVKEVGKPIAGKTGTTNDEKDAWFIGFSPDLVVGVYLGYDKPRHLGRGATGGVLAAPIVRDFMKVALADKPAVPFRVPAGIKLIRIDAKSGMRAGPGDSRVILEAFKPGTAPPDNYSVIGVTDADGRPLGGVARGGSRRAHRQRVVLTAFSFCSSTLEAAAQPVQRAKSRFAHELLAFTSTHDVKQRSVVRSRGALLRPGFAVSSQVPSDFRVRRRAHEALAPSGRRDSSNSVPPMRGGWSADRPHSFFRSRLRRATTLSRGDRDLSRRSTVAIFGRGPTKPAPGSGNRSRSDCPRHAIRPGGRGPDLPALRFAPQRGTPLLAPSFRIVSRKRPSEPGCESLYYKLDT